MEKLRGLTSLQVRKREQEGRVNTAIQQAGRNEKQIICDNLFTYFNFLNIVLFLLVAMTGKIRNGLFIGTVSGDPLLSPAEEDENTCGIPR